MTRHTNTGGGASKKSDPVLGVASCHLTTEIGILTRFTMQSRGQFVVGSGRGGHGENCFFCASSVRPATFRLLDRLESDATMLGARPRAPRAMQSTASHARWYDPEPLGGV